MIRNMKCGRWKLIPDPIMISETGETINGANRLSAIILSDCTVPLYIATHVPVEIFKVIDTGIPRSVSDSAKIEGRVFQSRGYPAVARAFLHGMGPQLPQQTSGTSYSNDETLEIMDFYKEALDFAFAVTPRNSRGVTLAAVRAVIARAYYTQDKDRLKLFGEGLMTGLVDNRKKDCAVVLLRNHLLKVSGGDKGIGGGHTGKDKPRANVYATTEYMLKAFLDYREVKRIEKVDEELFPIPTNDIFKEV